MLRRCVIPVHPHLLAPRDSLGIACHAGNAPGCERIVTISRCAPKANRAHALRAPIATPRLPGCRAPPPTIRPHVAADRPDDALRRDVRLVGDALGRVLVEQVGEDLLADVERVRRLARKARNSGSAADQAALATCVRALGEERSTAVLRAFGLYFQLANVAEAWHRVRSRRRYEREERIPRESLAEAFGRLAESGVEPAELARRAHASRSSS